MVLSTLAYVSKHGGGEVSLAELARKSCYSERAVRHALECLHASGLVDASDLLRRRKRGEAPGPRFFRINFEALGVAPRSEGYVS